ncbi:MAG TPA: 2-phosphosulfolactate phosphatase [Lacipirellula sp.]
MPTLNVHILPGHVAESALAGSVVIVIDLLRASSTICQTLASGAECVMPFLEVDETLLAASRYPRSEIALGGERNGRIIAGFNLGNSPLEYTPEAVVGRRVLFTTTNGTRALHHARQAKRTLIGCALNRQAVADAVAGEPQIDILCAGTDGMVTGEDILAAGAIVQSLVDPDPRGDAATMLHYTLDEGAQTALVQWQQLLQAAQQSGVSAAAQLAEQMRDTPGGRNLLEIGQEADLPACAQLDRLAIVPELNRSTGEIRPA